jgi:single-strand DNA-binding protein
MTDVTVGLVGNLTDDPELRFSSTGQPWLRARLSVKPYIPGSDVKPDAVLYDVVCFGSLAENVAATVRKGSRIIVSGRLEEQTWVSKDGFKRTGQKIIADGIGPDLRFETVTFNRTRRTSPTPVMDELVGPERPRTNTDAPF